MSINVTVKGNPISIRRGKMVLSDLENIRKTEKEHRKRLRWEQVHEQSKALSKKLLERARRIEQEHLNRLEKDGNTEMKRAHERRLLEFQRRYQDIENIGYAHENASKQPDIESIKHADEQRHKVAAKTRGAEAINKLQEANKAVSPQSKQQERLRKVRELENERSSMVANLPKKSCMVSDSLESMDNENIVKSTPASTSRRKAKCVVSKKSPIKKVSKYTKVHNTKSPSRISLSVNNEEMSKTSTTTSCMGKSKTSSPNKSTNVPKTISDSVPETGKVNVCESDDNEPRKTVPVTSAASGKPEKLIRSKTKSYQDSSSDLSTTSTASSSSISDDSSYFSDNNSKTPIFRKTPRHHTSPVSSKIDLYDHKTRQRNSYERPSGLVERMNIKNRPTAEDLAQEIMESENKESESLASQKENLKQRSQDAILREKIRRDYETLIKNLDLLSQQERKLKSKQVSNAADKQVLPPCKISEDLTKKQKQMDRVFQNILRTSRDPATSVDCNERSITITPRDYIHSKTTPNSEWKEPPYIDGQESEESYTDDDTDFTRKRMISELLIKIEKLKRKLLQEYGTDLPDEVFNASVKSLFNNRSSTSTSQEKVECNESKPITPEIQVINMSSCDEITKQPRKFIPKNKKPITKTPARNLSKPKCTTSTITTCDQQVQVAMESGETKKEQEIVSHPLEPLVKILTPENADSSSNSSTATDVLIDVSKKEITVVPKQKEKSIRITKDVSASSIKSTQCTNNKTPVKISFEQKGGGFEVAGLLIDTNKREITVLPKKKPKKTPETVTKKLSLVKSPYSQKSLSLPASRIASPTKKLSKSAPPSRQSSPKKIKSQTSKAKSMEKKVEKPQKTSPVKEQKFKTQYTQVSINSSTESSQLNSTSDNGNSSQIYTSYQTVASKHIVSQIQDASDASTTYMNLPAPVAGIFLDSNGSAILEMLDASAREELKQKSLLVSPISSPESASNISQSGQICRRLKFMSLMRARQMKTDSSSQTKTARTSTCTTTATTTTRDTSASVRTSTQSKPCTCKNPACQLFHEKVEDTQAYALKHCPEILKKYEQLQTVCTERIASLTDLIEKVRSEQRGLELSMVANGESTSPSQIISQTRSSVSGETSNLVKNIEAIHAQLKRTLMESQKIISGEGIELPQSLKFYEEIEKCPSFRFDLSKETSSSDSPEDDPEKQKCTEQVTPVTSNKPKVLYNERVNIRLDHFRLGQNARISGGSDVPATTTTTTETAPSGSSDQNEKVVEMLSKEILEQSKNINKSVPVDNLKDSDDSLLKSSQALVRENSEESSKNAHSNDENNQSSNFETNISDFIPLLAGIPKIPRKSSSTNGRTRPPVTLISGPYRPDIAVSPAHELSTIVELDTPDTVNKSQVSTRSPSNKAKKKLPVGVGSQLTKLSPSKKSEIKSTISKPSVHVAPLPAHRSPQFSFNSSKSATRSAEKSPKKSIEKISESFENKRIGKCESRKSISSDSMHTLPDMHIEQLQQSQDNADVNYEFRISQISELCSLPDENIDQMLISEICEESKSKSVTPEQRPNQEQAQKQEQEDKGQLTSTSSTSFSGLSGVSEITTTPSSDLNLFKCPSSPEEMELALKKWGLGWAIPTLKKTREASALGSSSSSDGTPVNAARLVSPVKKHQEVTPHDLPEISDVSSISIKHANKSTERSVLIKGRTSTPNRLSNSNSDGTISTLGSFSSDLNIVVQDQSADMTIPNISFSNNKLI